MPLQLVERAVPARLVAAAGLRVVQARMGENKFGAVRNGSQLDLNARLTRVLAGSPAPCHRQALGPRNLQILAAAFVLAAIELAEADPEAAANPHVGLGQQHRAGVGSPPMTYTFRRGESIEDN